MHIEWALSICARVQGLPNGKDPDPVTRLNVTVPVGALPATFAMQGVGGPSMLNGGHISVIPAGAEVPVILLLLEDPPGILNVGVLELLVAEVLIVGVLKLERELVDELVVVEEVDPTEKVLLPQMPVSSHTFTVCGPALAEFGTINEHPWDEGRAPPLAIAQLPLVVGGDPSNVTITVVPSALGLKPLPLITTLCPALPVSDERAIEAELELAKVTLNATAKLITSKNIMRTTAIEILGRIKLAIPLQKHTCPRLETSRVSLLWGSF